MILFKNTTGGGVGYLLGWFLVWLLPTRDEIDEHSFRVGTRVSGFRMGLAFLIDFVMLSLLYAVIERLETIPYVAVLAVYFALIPLWRGKTLGMALLKFRLHFDKQKWLRHHLAGNPSSRLFLSDSSRVVLFDFAFE